VRRATIAAPGSPTHNALTRLCRDARDGRVASIAGGTDEVMLGIIRKLEGTVPKAGHGA
jgi:citronellyl-CoA dehydrogenase